MITFSHVAHEAAAIIAPWHHMRIAANIFANASSCKQSECPKHEESLHTSKALHPLFFFHSHDELRVGTVQGSNGLLPSPYVKDQEVDVVINSMWEGCHLTQNHAMATSLSRCK